MDTSNSLLSKKETFDLEKNVLGFLSKYALMGFAAFVTSLSTLAALVYFQVKTLTPIIWIVGTIIVLVLSVFVRRRLLNFGFSHGKNMHISMLLNILEGSVIASLIIFMPHINDILRTVLIFAMVTSCIGSSIVTMGYRPFFLTFSIPVICSFLLSSLLSIWIWGASTLMYAVFGLTFLISIYIYLTSTGLYGNYVNAFLTNLENERINQKLQIAVKEAQTANRSKTRFLASASHDLRQPINTLSLFIATLSLKELDEENSSIVNHMTTAVKTIDGQLSSLLEISKLDSGVITPKMSKVNVVPLLEDMVKIYGEQYSTKKLVVIYKSKNKSIVLNTDQILFERILSNLISNAIKYTNEGTVEISVETIDSGEFLISIDDSGIGIAEENLEAIYDEFYQENNKERKVSEGFGLGLSIVKRLCDLLEIQIEITSTLGLGTKVKLKSGYLEAD